MSDSLPTGSLPVVPPQAWHGLVDDAAIFPPGEVPLPEAVRAHSDHATQWFADLVGSFVVPDTRIGEVEADLPLSVVVTGGAGGIDPAARLAQRRGRRLAGLEIALRDLDDLAGNARRVVAAVDHAQAEGHLDEEVPVFVELPQADVTFGWQSAADEVAAAGHHLKFRTGGVQEHLFPTAAQLAAWIDAALERETPFKCTAGLHHAVRHTDTATGFEHHGFLNVLVATAQLDAAPGGDDAVGLLEQRDAGRLLSQAHALGWDRLGQDRRWLTSFGSCSVTDPVADLISLGLLEAPQ